MKGIIFQIAGAAVSDAHGEDTWDDLLDVARSHGAYTALGDYPDDELHRIVGAAAEATGTPPEGVVRWLGEAAVPHLARAHADLFAAHPNTRSLLLALNTVIHPQVRMLYPHAQPPVFDFDTTDPTVLRMTYRSRRKMCAFAHGLVKGSAAHFGEQAEIEHEACVHDGDDACVLAIRLEPAA